MPESDPGPSRPRDLIADPATAEAVLAARARSLSLLAGGVWHELANPLGALTTFTALLRMDASVPANLKLEAEEAARATRAIHLLIRDYVELARIRPAATLPVRPVTLVRGILDTARHLLVPISVLVEVPDSLPDLEADPQALRHAFLAVALNAIAALGGRAASGTLRVTARLAFLGQAGTAVEIVVEDSAPAIPASARDHLFNDEPPASAGPRAGRDLAVARLLLQAQGGDLRFEPTIGGLNAFILRIPCAPGGGAVARSAVERGAAVRVTPDQVTALRTASEGTAPAERHILPPAPDTTAQRSGPTVLVVDNEPQVRMLVARALARAGMRGLEAGSAQAALAILEATAVDVVLADQGMPGMSGMDLLEALRVAYPELAARFILMTGDALSARLARSVADAGGRLLVKPFEMDALVRLVLELTGD